MLGRYEGTGEMQDLEEAIQIARLTVELMPEDHPDQAGCLINLGHKLGSRYERTGEIQDLENASKHYLQAWSYRTAIPFHRIRAAARGLKLLAAQGEFGKAAELARNVIDLLPLTIVTLSNAILDASALSKI